MRDAVEAASQVAAEAGVPRVGVGHVDIRGRVGHAQSSGQRLQCSVGLGLLQLRIHTMNENILFIAWGPRAVNGHINDLAHEAGQLRNVDARSAVNLRRVLLRKNSGSHTRPEYVSSIARAEG